MAVHFFGFLSVASKDLGRPKSAFLPRATGSQCRVGGIHLKWIRGSYNKHSRKTIITPPLPQPGSAVPSRRSRQLKGAGEELGMSYLRRKSTHGDSSDSPPPNTRLFTHNLMLQLVWRNYAVMSRSTSRCPLPRLPPHLHPLSRSHRDQPTKMSSFRLTDVAVPAHSSAYFMRVMQSVAGVVVLVKALHVIRHGRKKNEEGEKKPKKPSPAEKMYFISNKRVCFRF